MLIALSRKEAGPCVHPGTRPAPREYDAVLDDITSLLSDACEAMHESGRFDFCVNGVNGESWRADVLTELCIFLEQAPALVGWLTAGGAEDFTLSFYEQGVEMDMILHREGDVILVRYRARKCSSSPPGRFEGEDSIPFDTFRQMVREVLRLFREEARVMVPEIYQHPWFQAWLASVQPVDV